MALDSRLGPHGLGHCFGLLVRNTCPLPMVKPCSRLVPYLCFDIIDSLANYQR